MLDPLKYETEEKPGEGKKEEHPGHRPREGQGARFAR
jgi:hypothetical protein